MGSRVGFVVSHPFAGKTANGWGTEVFGWWFPMSQNRDMGHPGWFGFVVFHPFAGEMANGWGTEIVPGLRRTKAGPSTSLRMTE